MEDIHMSFRNDEESGYALIGICSPPYTNHVFHIVEDK